MEETYSLNGIWRFATDASNTGIDQQWMAQESQPYLEGKTREFVPSCWNRQSSKAYADFHGVGWY